MSGTTLLTSTKLIDTWGVNTHLPYTDGGYANATKVIESLNYLGLNNVRDWVINDKWYPGNEGQLSYPVAAQAGIKFVMNVISGSDVQHAVNLMHNFEAKFPGSIVGIEGPNEVNNWPVNFNGLTGDAGAIAFQTALFDAVNADSLLANKPVVLLTSYPVLVGPADASNTHFYPGNGDQPFTSLKGATDWFTALMPGKPFMLTETGYFSLPGNFGWGGVDEVTQAKLLLNLLCDSAKLGLEKVFIYQLLDAYSDPSMSDPEKHFGLFDINYKPKAAATAIHNLTTILKDGAETNPALQPLNYTLSGLTSNGGELIVQESSAVTNLVLWREPDIWDEAAKKPISAAADQVTLSLQDTYASVVVYDPMVGASPVATYQNVSTIKLSVVDHPLVVELSGKAAAAPAAQPAPLAPPAPQPAPEPIVVAPAPLPPPPIPSPTPAPSATAPAAVYGTAGDDVLTGDDEGNLIFGGAGFDNLSGKMGADTLHGEQGPDWVVGGKGNDKLYGGDGDDLVHANLGDDTCDGGGGADQIRGGQGDDLLIGGDGSDFLAGDRGADTVWGGAGADIFHVFADSGVDRIMDFNPLAGDRIQLDKSYKYTLTQSGQDVVIGLPGGAQVTLVNASTDALPSGWIYTG